MVLSLTKRAREIKQAPFLEYDREDGVARAALRLSPYVFVRFIVMRRALWKDIDLEAKEPVWRISSRTTKQRKAHIVPLSPQAVVILEEFSRITGPNGLVFKQRKDDTLQISENCVSQALRRLGYSGKQHTWHGWRTTASTLLREIGWEPELVERQLAHQIGDDASQAYDHSTRLIERRQMMLAYADYLDSLKNDRNINTRSTSA